MESRAYGVLGGKIGRIKASNVDPAWLAERLQAERIIGHRDVERAKDNSILKPERCGELVELMQGNGRRGVFQTFVNILLSEPHLEWLGEELKCNNIEVHTPIWCYDTIYRLYCRKYSVF